MLCARILAAATPVCYVSATPVLRRAPPSRDRTDWTGGQRASRGPQPSAGRRPGGPGLSMPRQAEAQYGGAGHGQLEAELKEGEAGLLARPRLAPSRRMAGWARQPGPARPPGGHGRPLPRPRGPPRPRPAQPAPSPRPPSAWPAHPQSGSVKLARRYDTADRHRLPSARRTSSLIPPCLAGRGSKDSRYLPAGTAAPA